MFVILQKYDFSSKSQHISDDLQEITDVCDTAKVRFFKQITTNCHNTKYNWEMFVILQKYDFSSKSQRLCFRSLWANWCLWYCKSTIFQANHNAIFLIIFITLMFVILQKYDFSSKSQLSENMPMFGDRCLWYCKSTIFQANHNQTMLANFEQIDVCDTAKVRFFKQITTCFCSQSMHFGCLWYCKSTIFQANHNIRHNGGRTIVDVCDTAKVRFFKQITTKYWVMSRKLWMFVILQKYDFSSKSQPATIR